MLALTLLLGGCTRPQSLNPVDWWHQLEGGAIAEARPPPPNADAPYPTVNSVPPRPPAPNAVALQHSAMVLLADRNSAQYVARVQPIPQLPPPAARVAPAPPAPATADDETPNASLAAASAPPRPTQPVTPAPAASPAQVAGPAGPVMADMPKAPPPPPQLADVSIPAVTAPTEPPVPPPPVPTPPAPPGPPVAIPFAHGSALLTTAAQMQIGKLSGHRGRRGIAITGFGEATSDDPAAQEAALPLALARARAVAGLLVDLGVPAFVLHVAALPSGGGATARLVD